MGCREDRTSLFLRRPRAGPVLSYVRFMMHSPSTLPLSQPGEVTAWHTTIVSSFFLHAWEDVWQEGTRNSWWLFPRCIGDHFFFHSFIQLRCFNFSSASCIFAGHWWCRDTCNTFPHLKCLKFNWTDFREANINLIPCDSFLIWMSPNTSVFCISVSYCSAYSQG